MRLFRFGSAGQELPGLLDGAGVPRDASGFVSDYSEEFFARDGLERLTGVFGDASSWPVVDLSRVRLGSPIARPSKLIGVGLNYREHAAETGAELPTEPKIFMKATTAICGVHDDVLLPPGAQQLDYEVELAVVIGKRTIRVSVEDASDSVLGFTICNDYSERNWQKNRAGQFVKGKSADTFAPLGPFLITREEGDFSDKRLWCSVNGVLRQDARTRDMVFGIPQLIASISQYMTLLPLDVITTGTPSGVGLGMSPPTFLRAGDQVRYGIEGIGEGEQRVVPVHDGTQL